MITQVTRDPAPVTAASPLWEPMHGSVSSKEMLLM